MSLNDLNGALGKFKAVFYRRYMDDIFVLLESVEHLSSFRSLFFDVEKRRQCSEVVAIPFITDLFKIDAFSLYRDWNKLMINQYSHGFSCN